MNAQELKTKKNLQDLQSGSKELIINTLDRLRFEGNSTFVPVIFEILFSTTDEEIKQIIFNFLIDIKDQNSVPALIEVLKNTTNEDQLKTIMHVYWESPLDFSEYLSVFVEIFIREKFEIAFDAFTVIENMDTSYEKELIMDEIFKINKMTINAIQSKNTLKTELITILKSRIAI
jgi:hypothetical protein